MASLPAPRRNAAMALRYSASAISLAGALRGRLSMEEGWDAAAAAAAISAAAGDLAATGTAANTDGLAGTGAAGGGGTGGGAAGDGAARTAPIGIGATTFALGSLASKRKAATVPVDVDDSVACCAATAGGAAGSAGGDAGRPTCEACGGDADWPGGGAWTAAGGLDGDGSPRPASPYHAKATTPTKTPAAASFGHDRGGSGGRA
jgi:hypothetical protein